MPTPRPSINEVSQRRSLADLSRDEGNQPAGIEIRQRNLITRQAAVLRSIIDFHDQQGLMPGLLAVAGGLQARFRCERVSIGFWDGTAANVAVISQQASVEHNAPETRLINDAMTEACEFDRVLQFPTVEDAANNAIRSSKKSLPNSDTSTPAHRSLAVGRQGITITTVPLCHDATIHGALILESPAAVPMGQAKRDLLQQIADTLAPMIASRRMAERSLVRHLSDTTKSRIEQLIAPKHLRLKLGTFFGTLLILALAVVPLDQRVTASAELVPIQLRTVTAPVDGYIRSVDVNPGDQVEEGQLLASLDTRELELERGKAQGELSRVSAELRAVRAAGDRKQTAMLKAQRDQARSHLTLLEQRISRSAIVAPQTGLIVSANLSQLVGAPVQRGQRLVEIAPDTRYTITLMVAERDVGLISSGQSGLLSLQAQPDERMALQIDRIHPIALADEGQNRFRVEATLTDAPAGLLPGQTGVGKVHVGQASALRIFTRRFSLWLRLTYWTWLG